MGPWGDALTSGLECLRGDAFTTGPESLGGDVFIFYFKCLGGDALTLIQSECTNTLIHAHRMQTHVWLMSITANKTNHNVNSHTETTTGSTMSRTFLHCVLISDLVVNDPLKVFYVCLLLRVHLSYLDDRMSSVIDHTHTEHMTALQV